MSVKVMALVWGHAPYEGSALLTLLAIADRADDSGLCWPSVSTLAKKTRQNERTVQRCIARMVDDGFLSRTFRKEDTSKYRVNIKKLKSLAEIEDEEGGDNMSPGGGNDDMGGVTPRDFQIPLLSPNTSTDVNKHSSIPSSSPNGSVTPIGEPKDQRHGYFVKTHEVLYMEKNNCPRAEVPWNGREARALKKFLTDHPGWTEATLRRCLTNRFASEVNHRESPIAYICRLNDYAGGPLDKYGNPMKRATEPPPRAI